MKHLTRPRLSAVVLLLLAAVALTGLTASPAAALTGKQYDGTDPNATGCASSAITAKYTHLYFPDGTMDKAMVELRYSRTCRTAWARLTGARPYAAYPTYVLGGWAMVDRIQDGTNYICTADSTGFCYTRQVYDGGYTSAAEGHNSYLDSYANRHWSYGITGEY